VEVDALIVGIALLVVGLGLICVPKTMRQSKRSGSGTLAGGLLFTAVGLIFTIAAFTVTWE
jgi:hypothetical protein